MVEYCEVTGPGLEEDDDFVEEEEEDEEEIYNPLKLPLGWDGKPIPYWLYKLHGLNLEFTCEICGRAWLNNTPATSCYVRQIIPATSYDVIQLALIETIVVKIRLVSFIYLALI